ncbi:hypothetical protein [Bacillus atrophaeus]|uniref:hypothetical protein n=1 Tax=Bacillus atrophaeus TaxID=1452 RepID=UPI002E1E20D1|nr:hypothetical protein [Bacillus atrophaeus]MED1032523.1 hypothetical protein [Bacillus atrophaeus]MED1121031.1 hypothetical protein [Bacillus atrophaeus]
MSLLVREVFVEIKKKPNHRYDYGLFEIKGLPNLLFRFKYLAGDADSIIIEHGGKALRSKDGSFTKGEKIPYNFSPQKIKILRDNLKYLLSLRKDI